MTVASLPTTLQDKLDLLARRLHRLRLLRGASWFAITAALGAGVCLGLDAFFELPPLVRIAMVVVWIGSSIASLWYGLLRPLRNPVTAAHLAAAVEEEYPRLSERLTSSVELADADEFHGSPAFVRLLVRETDLKTRALDFLRAAPPHAAEWLTAIAVATLLLLAAPAIFWPEYYAGLGRRLLMPWDRRPAVMPFAIDVSPGDVYAARGRPLTIGVELTAIRDGIPLPEYCTLILAEGDGKPVRLRMSPGDRANTFTFRLDELKQDCRYFVEAGALESNSHTVMAVDPVELAGGPTTTLTPPAYATAMPPRTVEGMIDLSILQHGGVQVDCKFDRPAESATLMFTPIDKANMPTQRLRLALAGDRLSGRVELPARIAGKLQLELAAPHGITTSTPGQSLIVVPDRPPQFQRVGGLPERGQARPTDSLSIDVAVIDDLAVAKVEMEYRINDAAPIREPVVLAGIGTPSASGRFEFKLAGKAKEGERILLRLRAVDNRNVPEINLGPNVVTYPPGDRWSELRISAGAESVQQQAITAKRDDFEQRLRELIAHIDRTIRRTYALHQNIEQRRANNEEQASGIRGLTDEQALLSQKLDELVREAGIAGLTPLAEKVQAVGDQEFRVSAESFRDARQAADVNRVALLRRAEIALTEARAKLEALLQDNRDLANARLDEVKLNELAERERELAEQAKDAKTPEEREKLSQEQKRIADELNKMTQDSSQVQEAVQAAQAAESRRLAEEARKLAQAERDLDNKLKESEKQQNVGKLADLARQQEKLANEIAQLARQTRDAAKDAKSQPLSAEDAAKAAEALRRGDADQAQQKQEQAARDLERMSNEFQRAIETARDPKEAAKQLSRLQDQNRQRLENRPAERAALLPQQEAIGKAIENLRIPEENAPAQRLRQQAKELATEAARALTRNDSDSAEFRMGQAKETLDRLTKQLPSGEERSAKARTEVSQLRKLQDDIAQQAEKAERSAEKGDKQKASEERAEAAKKEAEVAERLGKLDVPGQDVRRERAAQAAAQAMDDLQNPKSPDVSASQQNAKRNLERLAEALAGLTPGDEKARQLARQERELAEATQKAGQDADAQKDLQQRQQKITEETIGLKPSDANVRQGEATQAVMQANGAVREQPTAPATQQKLLNAADQLDKLADQLSGRESEVQRAERLAKKQEAAAQQPPANPIESRRQTNQILGETRQLRAGEQSAAEKKKAQDALSRVQQTNPGTPENAKAQKDAAEAMRQLADQMSKQEAVKDNAPSPSPDDLARKQRELARATESANKQPNQMQQLQRQQAQLRQQAERLPSGQAPKAMQQAKQAMDQAEQALSKKDAAEAQHRQQQAANALDQAARQIAKHAASNEPKQMPPEMPSHQQTQQADRLAQQQRDLREQVRRATEGTRPSDAEQAAANQQQGELANKAGELSQKLQQAAEGMSNESAQQSTRSASESAKQGGKSMQQSQAENPGQAKQTRQQAAQALDRAAEQADQAAKSNDPGTRRASPNGRPQDNDQKRQSGEAVEKAQGQMSQAQEQLGKGEGKQAEGSMQKAADALQQAARQLGQRNPESGPREGAERPATEATAPKKAPTEGELPKELQKYAGKKWGELPGELQTRIIQEMKSQYGDDYARVIKLYFEQIAENKAKNREPK